MVNMLRTLAFWFFLTLTFQPSFALEPTAANTQSTISVLDGLGQPITLDSTPLRVSSKTLFTDAILLAILPHDQISSLTNIVDDPSYSILAGNTPTNLAKLAFNAEAIIANQPDLVFAANWTDAGLIKQVTDAGIPVYRIQTLFTIHAIQQQIREIGELLAVSEPAHKLIAQMNDELNALGDKRATIAQRNWVALDYNAWGTASGKDSTWQAVLNHTGLANGTKGFEATPYGQVPLSKELIVSINPDVLFVPGDGQNSQRSSLFQQVLNDPALQGVNAIIHGRVYAVPEALRGTYSQYITQTISHVINAVYADLQQPTP